MEFVAKPGTVSHGTLKTDDLLRAFAAELLSLIELGADEPTPVDKGWLFDLLSDALNEYAPPGHYFGAHEG